MKRFLLLLAFVLLCSKEAGLWWDDRSQRELMTIEMPADFTVHGIEGVVNGEIRDLSKVGGLVIVRPGVGKAENNLFVEYEKPVKFPLDVKKGDRLEIRHDTAIIVEPK